MKNWLLSSSAPNLYVVVPTIEEYSKIILHKHYEKPLCSSLDNLFTFAEFKECYGTFCFHEDTTITLSDTDIWFILRYLSSRYGIAIEDSVKTYGSMCTVIKYPERNESEIVPAEITGNDKAIINLKTTCVALHRQVNELQAKSEKFMKLSREHHANKRKPQAIYTLKKKKQIEEILDRRLKSLETMETILLKIEASQNDIQVVQAFNMGADTLRDILNSKDMNIDTVDKTMEKIQSALEGQKELDNIITQSTDEINQSFMNISDQELEEELRMIDNIHIHNDHNEADHVTVHNTPMNENNTLMHSDHSQADTTRVHRNPKNKEMAEYDNYKDKKKIPPLTESINTESELLRLQNVLSSLSAPKKKRKTMELAQ
ncbi:Snf7-domain-containing protein [Pilobolus umbonatus]|nr:Snf7-domain-containing protein [Pilobolus umbonatus]